MTGRGPASASPWQLLERSEALLALRRWPDAQRLAQEALSADPGSEKGHALLSRALVEQGDYDEALAAAEAGLSANPSSEWLHRLRSLALFWARRYDAALLAADEAIRLLPTLGAGHSLRAMALKGLGRASAARSAAERAVALSPDSAEFRAGLGDTWLDEDPATAERYYRESLAIDPEQPLVLNNLGVALLRQKRRVESALAFKSAVLLDPHRPLPKRNVLVAANPMLIAPRILFVGAGVAFVAALVLIAFTETRFGNHVAGWGGVWLCIAIEIGLLRLAKRLGRKRLAAIDPQLAAIHRKIEADLRAGRIDRR